MLRRVALALLAVAAAGPAFGQAYPNKPINLIVPFAAGGPTDVMARILGERMGKELGQQIVIDNVTGAAGSIAMGKLARSAPDGYTIGIGHLGTNVVNGAIYKNLNYDLINDLEPIALLPSNPLLVVTSNQIPAKDLKELVAYLKANADKISGGTAGLGSGSHIGALAFFAVTGTNYQLVPYRGTGPAVQDLIANQIQIMIDQSSNSLPHIRAGKLKVYGLTSDKPSPLAPDLPAIGMTPELAGFDLGVWFGLFMPSKTPADVQQKVQEAAAQVLADPGVRKKLADQGLSATGTSAETLKAFMNAEVEKYQSVVKAAKIKPE